MDSNERWNRLVNAARGGAKNEIRFQIDSMFGLAPNPGRADRNEEDDDDTEDDVSPSGEDFVSYHFDDKEIDNLASASGAYRMLGAKGDLVAFHRPTKSAFFGTPRQLEEFIAHREDLDDDQWTLYEDADQILEMDYDPVTMKSILRQMDNPTFDDAEALANAEELFEKFHWGDKSNTVAIKHVPGIEGPLTFLGVGRQIEYGSKKDGEWIEFYHEFGEESKTFPGIYSNSDGTVLVIHGGKMHVTADGIVD